jgi:hypothetical protein
MYENLLVKSVGLNIFNILGASPSISVDDISFSCVVILSVYLTLSFVIPSLIFGGNVPTVCFNASRN